MSETLLDTINTMTDEEIDAANLEMGKKLIKRAALNVAITVALVAVSHYIVKKIEEHQN